MGSEVRIRRPPVTVTLTVNDDYESVSTDPQTITFANPDDVYVVRVAKGPAAAQVSLQDAGGTTVLTASAAAMRDVKTTHFAIDVQGTVAGIALHRAEGTLTRAGEAKGTATVEQAGSPLGVGRERGLAAGALHRLADQVVGDAQLPLARRATQLNWHGSVTPEARGRVVGVSSTRRWR